jgi:long-chain fatty acid transport protein
MQRALTLASSAALAATVAVALVIAPAPASAGGFFLADRGARALARGGAFVAGVDDPHALWYNPAGLAYSGDQLLIDGTLTLFETSFTRIDGGGTTQPTVVGRHAYLPIPTVAGSFSFDELPNLTFGLGAGAPNAALMEWPQSITVDGVEYPAPQRYSLLSLEGSLLASVNAGVAWRPIRELSIGLSTYVLAGSFDAQVALSACDGVICSFPEDPEYDAVAQISLPVVTPFAVLGAVADLGVVRIGASVSTPFNLEGSALVQVRAPAAAAFSGAEVVNRRDGCGASDASDPCRADTRADVQLEFPWVMRLGVEARPVPELRLEAAVVWETWSVQDEARIVPRDVWIQGALGGALDYQVGPISVPRNMNDTVSVRLGGAYTIDRAVTVSLGGYWENGAFSDRYLSVLTVDSDKVLMAGGVSVNVSDALSLDAVGGFIWLASRQVRDSLVPQPNPIRPPVAPEEAIYVGNGDYAMSAPFFGLGLRWRPDEGHIRGPGEDADVLERAAEPALAEPLTPPASSDPDETARGGTQTLDTPPREGATQAVTPPSPVQGPPAPAAADEREERPRERRPRRPPR